MRQVPYSDLRIAETAPACTLASTDRRLKEGVTHMLVVTRRVGESLIMGLHTVKVIAVHGDEVQIRISPDLGVEERVPVFDPSPTVAPATKRRTRSDLR